MLSSMSCVNGHTGAARRSLRIKSVRDGAACILDLRIGTVCWTLIIPTICIASRLDYVSQMSLASISGFLRGGYGNLDHDNILSISSVHAIAPALLIKRS